jgi:hypothetical protein
MKTGIERIAEERARQIEKEGFDSENDKNYLSGQLIDAAIAYAMICHDRAEDEASGVWPWDIDWFKPGSAIRNLEKAGALISAEIDRRILAGEQ